MKSGKGPETTIVDTIETINDALDPISFTEWGLILATLVIGGLILL